MTVIRRGSADELHVFAELFRNTQMSIGANVDLYPHDWLRRFEGFCREQEGFRFYLAETNGSIIGSAGAHYWRSPFPNLSGAEVGYVWGVYVEPTFRGNGYGNALTRMVVNDLQSEKCVEIRLHASPMARLLYERRGFVAGTEMRLSSPAFPEP